MVNSQTTPTNWGELPGFHSLTFDMTPILVGETHVAKGMAERMNLHADQAALEREALQMNIQLNLKPKAKVKEEVEKKGEKSEKEKNEEAIKEGRLPFYVVTDGRAQASRHKAELEKLEQIAEQGN